VLEQFVPKHSGFDENMRTCKQRGAVEGTESE
jgi:hypothetical protein